MGKKLTKHEQKNIAPERIITEKDRIKRAKKQKKIALSKKQRIAIIASVSSVCVVALTLGLVLGLVVFKDKPDYFEYFNDFKSKPVTKAECTLNLSDGTYVFSYDAKENVFITARRYKNGTDNVVEMYGLASSTEEYCRPYYGKILQIRGDFALVARPPKGGESGQSYYLDVIRYKGSENAPYSLMSKQSVIYIESTEQMGFVGDSVYVYGDVNEPSATPSCITFYDYSSGAELLEKYKIRTAYDALAASVYKVKMYDDLIVAYSTDKAYFYSTRYNPNRGYLEPVRNGGYVPFEDMTEEALGDYERELNVYYLGNGWFVRSAMIFQYTYPWNGFNLRLEGINENATKYCKTKADFFNAYSGTTKENKEIYCVSGVANKYSYDYYARQAYMLGSLRNENKDDGYTEYSLPFANPSAMIKDGYSIIYYYYLPYVEMYANDDVNYLGYTGETTFCITDTAAKSVQPENALMPIAYVDGIGVQNADPEYSEISGTAYCYNKYMESTLLASFNKGSESYYPYYANKEAVIVKGNIKDETGEITEKYSAIKPDGTRITGFVYDEMTYFSGGYALARRKENGVSALYRIDETGNEQKIEDALTINQGTYTFRNDDKVGLKNYKGDVLIEATKGATIMVSDETMEEGDAVRSVCAVTDADGRTQIYVLE